MRTNGEVLGRHYQTGQTMRLTWDQGRISSLESINVADSSLPWLAPGLVDLQINGFAGVDFQQDNLTAEELLRAARGLRRGGCTRFFLTLITDDWKRMVARLEHLHRLRAASDELKESIAGWHIEGPFLSAEPGFAGAHDATVMCDPTAEHLQTLRQITGTDPVLITLAPERLNAIAVIPVAVSLGFRVSLGHTDATSKRLHQALHAGATGFTHLGNGCPRQLDRHDNIIWRVFETPQLIVSLIPDAVHIPAPLFRIIHRNLNHIYYTSDAMAAAGAPPGRYRIGKLEVEVGEDHIVRKPGSPLFAGSGLQPITGVFRAAEMLGSAWQQPWQRFSEMPPRFMGWAPPFQVGEPAHFCQLVVTPENRLESLRVWFRGEVVEGDF